MNWIKGIFSGKNLMKRKRIYADHAAITPVSFGAKKRMAEVMQEAWGNPSALYREGVEAKKVVSESRAIIAKYLHAHSDEVIFTGSGTEANALAFQGFVRQVMEQRKCSLTDLHVILSSIEHSSLMETARSLEKQGLAVSYAPVDARGVVDQEGLKKLFRKNTVWVSLMMVNNEVGTIQPVREVAKLIRWARKHITESQLPVFHVDASQAILYQDLSMETLGADLVTLDAHKMYGPRGIGLLWVRRGIELSPLIEGGKQERGLRSGTENVPAIAGFAQAFLEINPQETIRLAKLSQDFIKKVKAEIPGAHLHGEHADRSPHIVNWYFEKVVGDYLVIQLDAFGISCATKSACLRDADESYVLRAMGMSHEWAANSVRFSFGKETTESQVKALVEALKRTIALQRAQTLQ